MERAATLAAARAATRPARSCPRAARRPGPQHCARPDRGTGAVAADGPVRPVAAPRRRRRTAWRSPGCATCVRGWNGAAQSPVADARWALARLAERFPGCPSRWSATRWAAGPRSPSPTAPPSAPSSGSRRGSSRTTRSTTLAGRRVLIAHGNARPDDRPGGIGALRRTGSRGRCAGDLRRRSASGTRCCAAPGLWHEMTTRFVLAALCGRLPREADRRAR